jgi:transcriptional regulator with XRE-family HTH domain
MDTEDISPTAIASELGERLKQARLNIDFTQADLADRAGVSRKVLMNAEKGKVQLESLVAIMLALDLSDNLNAFLPQQRISPIQLARLQNKKRQRASGRKSIKHKVQAEW